METDSTQSSESVLKNFTPPYNLAFRTLLNFIQRLEEEGGTPPRIDRSTLRNMSGQGQTYLMSGLKAFGLIQENGDVTPELDRLVMSPEQRSKLIGELLRTYYPAAIEHGEMNGTPKQLEEVFDQYDSLGPHTIRKAMTFFLHAAEYAEVPISRYVKVIKAKRAAPGAKRATPRKKPSGGSGAAEPPKIGQKVTSNAVTLSSGGTVTLQVAVDLFSLSAKDRDFVFALIDQIKGYEGKQKD